MRILYGYIRVEGDTYTYNVSDNIVTLLPAQSDPQKEMILFIA